MVTNTAASNVQAPLTILMLSNLASTNILLCFLCRWERSGFDATHSKLTEQLHTISAEVDAVVATIEVAQTAERHAAAETQVLKAQGDAEQVSDSGPAVPRCGSRVCCQGGLWGQSM